MMKVTKCLDGYGGEDAILLRADRIEVARGPEEKLPMITVLLFNITYIDMSSKN
jgi:hypothetical protein